MTKGIKFDGDKPRWDLLPMDELEEVVKVLTKGAIKYKDENWKIVKPFFNRYFAAAMRHLKARKEGEIYDEDGETHLAHAATNLLFLMYGDNKQIDLHEKKIALDIDEVLADFATWHIKHYKTGDQPVNRLSYGLYYGFYDDFKKSLKDKKYWLSMPTLTHPNTLNFEPDCYITHRLIPQEWTEEWITINGFPIRPVICEQDKAKVCIERGIDIMVDDTFTNFISITNAGIKCLLFDRPHNKKFEVGNLRINSLKEIV